MENTINLFDLQPNAEEERAETLIGVAPPLMANVEDQTEDL